jgi:UDP-N-acetylmuramoyl-tripeptide--D-alanyl-D-alanine ligase
MNARSLAWVEDVLAREELLVSARLGEAASREWHGAVIDSRAECSGRIFFAIRGDSTDGHRYVADAYAAGGVAAVVEDGAGVEVPHLVVRSSTRALQELARAYRADFLEARVVAVTGSAGKTTTKEYIRAVMRTKYRVHSNPGNYNSLIGAPVAVLEAEPDCEYLVSEVGANAPGEIDFLARLLRPDLGVITNIGDAHVGRFGSRDAIASAKGELLDHVEPSGAVVLPFDDPYFDTLRRRSRAKVYSFGLAGGDFVLSSPREEPGRRLSFEVNGVSVTIEAFGAYNAANACAAYATGEVCGVEPKQIARSLSETRPMAGRGRVHERGGVLIVDESYNASPASMMLSLSMLADLSGPTRRIAVLGDMKELGGEARSRHEDVGRHAAGLGLDAIWWVGEEVEHVARGIQGAGSSASLERYATAEEAAAAARGRIRAGDAVLVKASRAVALDRFVEELLRAIDEGTVR